MITIFKYCYCDRHKLPCYLMGWRQTVGVETDSWGGGRQLGWRQTIGGGRQLGNRQTVVVEADSWGGGRHLRWGLKVWGGG